MLDFQLGVERGLNPRDHRLVNCSTEQLYCADGELFNVVLPRSCDDLEERPGTAWRLGALETRIIAVLDQPGTRSFDPLGIGPFRSLYLQTNQHPEVIYEYRRGHGVVTIFYDIDAQLGRATALDFAQMAREGRLAAFEREVIGDGRRSSTVMHLQTLDQFAPCREPAAGAAPERHMAVARPSRRATTALRDRETVVRGGCGTLPVSATITLAQAGRPGRVVIRAGRWTRELPAAFLNGSLVGSGITHAAFGCDGVELRLSAAAIRIGREGGIIMDVQNAILDLRTGALSTTDIRTFGEAPPAPERR